MVENKKEEGLQVREDLAIGKIQNAHKSPPPGNNICPGKWKVSSRGGEEVQEEEGEVKGRGQLKFKEKLKIKN